MRNGTINCGSVTLTLMVGLAIFAIALARLPAAHAQTYAVGKGFDRAPGVHQSVLSIRASEGLPVTRTVTIGRNKSLLVELPRELRDVIVSAPDIVDAVVQTSNRVYLIGKGYGQANAFFFDKHGERVLTLEISVEVDTRPLDSILRRFIPNSNIRSEMLRETVILTGSVRNPADSSKAEEVAARFGITSSPSVDGQHQNKVINMLVVEGEEQVMLRVKIAEVQRATLKQLGVNIGAAFQNGNGIVSILSENKLPVTTAEGLTGLARTFTNAQGLASTAGVIANSGVAGAWSAAEGARSIAYTLKALERNGLVRTLAEPNLTAVSGESANFLAGGEFPIPVAQDNDKVTVEFKEFGVGLAFTPVVLSEGRISLKISSEVSELSTNGAVQFSGIAIPALTKRRTDSTVELPSGGTLAISGLVSNNMQKNIDGFPGLKEIPILGTLFRSTDFVNKETELVVIVTPYIVRPTAKSNLAAPTDGLAPATDVRTYLLGHLNRIHGRSVALPAGSLKDSYGFIVE
ncbi:MAG: type II and III secretion system protein family protein [Hyphomicrobiaceae bacterium]